MGAELVRSVAVAKEVDGLEMGVLADGTAYLTGRGVSRLCGVASSAIANQTQRWAAGDRSGKFARSLTASGYAGVSLCLDVTTPGGAKAYAYPDVVSTAFLDYYAFEAPSPSPQALRTYRMVARAGLRLFVYAAVGYDPSNRVPDKWRQFHDRLALCQVPRGYFSAFRECADIVLSAIRGGLPVDDKTVPDISVGKLWGAHWEEQRLGARYGAKQRALHHYPNYFPQAASNPQPIWVYPLAALGEFRTWLQGVYLPTKFPNYLKSKVKQGLLSASVAELLLEEVNPGAPALSG